MTYLGVELERASALAVDLRLVANRADVIADDVSWARAIADVVVPVDGLLEQIRTDCLASAARIERAVQFVQSYRLPPVWTGWGPSGAGHAPTVRQSHRGEQMVPWSPAPARWNAASDTPWNQVHQQSSHNSYVSSLGVDGLYDLGVRSFELDIHRGAPTDFTPRASLLWDLAVDHVTHGGGRPDDWWVYHSSFDPHSEYDSLGQGLAEIAKLPATDPLTVFIDIKDAFSDTYGPALLDRLLLDAFGERLFTPANALATAPGADTLHAAVVQAGWPTLAELNTRVIVVLTGRVDGYHDDAPRAFVAGAPIFGTTNDGGVAHLPDPSVVFYNAHHRSLTAAEIAAVTATGSIIRTYGHDDCADQVAVHSNYLAVDITNGADSCAT